MKQKIVKKTDYLSMCMHFNLPISSNQIGTSGENLVVAMLSYYPFFHVYFLDGKAPVEDIFVELSDKETPYPFLVQVKSTTHGVDSQGALHASLTDAKKNELIKRPLPTYLVGVDLDTRDMYICSVFQRKQSFSKIRSRRVVNISDSDGIIREMSLLKNDVVSFWKKTNVCRKKKQFNSRIR